MSPDGKDLIQRWFNEVWNKGRAEAIDEMLTADATIHGLSDTSGMPISSPDAFREFHKQFTGAFLGITVDVDDVFGEGDKAVARCTVRGKHSGDHLGLAATNADVEITGIAIIKVKDGKIVEAWNNFDFLKLNQQLGVL